MIRLAFTIFTAFMAILVLSPIGVVAWPFRRDGAVGFGVARLCAHIILRAARVTTATEFMAPLPHTPVVFVSNHVNVLDIPILFAALPRPFRIVYKSSLLYVPLMGLFLAASRHIAIDRSRAFKARRSLAAAARRIRNGVSVALFPEGTRSGDAGMGAFKLGSFKLAIEAQAPVVPVTIIGLGAVMGRRYLKPGHVRVRIHQALAAESGPNAVEGLASRAEAIMRKEIES